MIDYENDIFRARVNRQIMKGVHHHRTAKRADKEYCDLSQLSFTEPGEQDKDWWQLRAEILAVDGDTTRPDRIETRLN